MTTPDPVGAPLVWAIRCRDGFLRQRPSEAEALAEVARIPMPACGPHTVVQVPKAALELQHASVVKYGTTREELRKVEDR